MSPTIISTPDGRNPFDPTTAASQFTVKGPFPNGAVFEWVDAKNNGIVAYRVERAIQGSNGWAVAATTCTSPSGIQQSLASARFIDAIPGIVPNTTYQYRVTAYAATGDVGANTVVWTAPNDGTLQWVSTSVSGSAVTLRWRYDPPATNPPVPPAGYRITMSDGTTRPAGSGSCMSVAGCSYTANGIPPGTHTFTLTAGWVTGTSGGRVGWVPATTGTRSTQTTVAVP